MRCMSQNLLIRHSASGRETSISFKKNYIPLRQNSLVSVDPLTLVAPPEIQRHRTSMQILQVQRSDKVLTAIQAKNILGENLQIVPLLLQLNVIGEKLGNAILDLACVSE